MTMSPEQTEIMLRLKKEQCAQSRMMNQLYELENHFGEAMGRRERLPVLEVDQFNSSVRGFFIVRYGFMPTITINIHAFENCFVRDLSQTMAHELIHFDLWRMGEPHWEHDELFWKIGEGRFDHYGPNMFGPDWLPMRREVDHLMEPLA